MTTFTHRYTDTPCTNTYVRTQLLVYMMTDMYRHQDTAVVPTYVLTSSRTDACNGGKLIMHAVECPQTNSVQKRTRRQRLPGHLDGLQQQSRCGTCTTPVPACSWRRPRSALGPTTTGIRRSNPASFLFKNKSTRIHSHTHMHCASCQFQKVQSTCIH